LNKYSFGKKILLLDRSKRRKTDFPFAVTKKGFQSILNHSPSRIRLRHNRLSTGKLISQQSCLFSFFFLSADLPFFPEWRRKKKPTQQGIVQKRVYSFLANFKEKGKGR